MLKLSKLQSTLLLSKNWLNSRAWFPHVPLALASTLSGLMYLAPQLKDILDWNFLSTLFGDGRWGMLDLAIWGVSQSAIGALLLIMSLGLLWRSRFAWTTCVLVISIALLLQINAAATPAHGWRIIIDVILLLLLLPAYSRFDRHNIRLGTLFAFASLVVFMGYAVLGSYRLGDQFDPPITDLTSALYFVIVTITSVGYGDITPATMETRVFLITMIILGITVLGTAVGATLVPAFINRLEQVKVRRETIMKRSNHYIIVGYSALASNTYRELVSRGEQVSVILHAIPENSQIADIDVIIGDGSDVDTLRKAGGEEAKAILALLSDDSENAFVILAAKELKSGVKAVAAVNDAKNLHRIRKVHPYMIVAPQVLGGELLSMALTGEKVDSSTILQRLMGQAKLVAEKKA